MDPLKDLLDWRFFRQLFRIQFPQEKLHNRNLCWRQLRETHARIDKEKNNKWKTWASAGVEDENNDGKSKEEKEAGANDGRKNVHSDRTWFTIEV